MPDFDKPSHFSQPPDQQPPGQQQPPPPAPLPPAPPAGSSEDGAAKWILITVASCGGVVFLCVFGAIILVGILTLLGRKVSNVFSQINTGLVTDAERIVPPPDVPPDLADSPDIMPTKPLGAPLWLPLLLEERSRAAAPTAHRLIDSTYAAAAHPASRTTPAHRQQPDTGSSRHLRMLLHLQTE